MAVSDALKRWREQAFLALIRFSEFHQVERMDAYQVRSGGAHFADLLNHPGRKQKEEASSASGAYQITYPTFTDAVRQGVAQHLFEHDQDMTALYLARGVMHYIHDGDIDSAMAGLTGKRDSLPGAGIG